MDDSTFLAIRRDRKDGRMSDLENKDHAGMFLFYKCSTSNSKLLKHVSIKNTKYVGNRNDEQMNLCAIPQTALMKYVRNAPTSLQWFRSDLSYENITILQYERPDIQLTN